MTPAAFTTRVGTGMQFIATGTFSDLNTQILTSSVTWSSSDPIVVTIDPQGTATVKTSGTVTITATVGSISGSTTLTVVP